MAAKGNTGTCQFVYSPTERYQHREWGESCGRETYAAYEEVEIPEMQDDGQVKVRKAHRERDQADPYCPLHGGTKDPHAPDEEEEDNGDIFKNEEEVAQFTEAVKLIVQEELAKIQAEEKKVSESDSKVQPQKVVTKNAPARNRGSNS